MFNPSVFCDELTKLEQLIANLSEESHDILSRNSSILYDQLFAKA